MNSTSLNSGGSDALEIFDILTANDTMDLALRSDYPNPELLKKYRTKYEKCNNQILVRMLYSQNAIFAWCIPNPENRNLPVTFILAEEIGMEESIVKMLENGRNEKFFTYLKNKLILWARYAGQMAVEKKTYCFAPTPDPEELDVLRMILEERFQAKKLPPSDV